MHVCIDCIYVWITEEISKINSERKINSGRQRNGFAARGRPRRCESALQDRQGALRAPPGAHRGRLGLWVLLRLRLTLADRALRVHALFSELALRSELILSNPAIL